MLSHWHSLTDKLSLVLLHALTSPQVWQRLERGGGAQEWKAEVVAMERNLPCSPLAGPQEILDCILNFKAVV